MFMSLSELFRCLVVAACAAGAVNCYNQQKAEADAEKAAAEKKAALEAAAAEKDTALKAAAAEKDTALKAARMKTLRRYR